MAVCTVQPSLSCSWIASTYRLISLLGGVEEELDEDVIDEGAWGWLRNACAVVDCAGVVDDELEEEDCKMSSEWLSDVGPD